MFGRIGNFSEFYDSLVYICVCMYVCLSFCLSAWAYGYVS